MPSWLKSNKCLDQAQEKRLWKHLTSMNLSGGTIVTIKSESGISNKSFWSTGRITVFLTVWALVIPFKIMINLSRLSSSIIYAGLWSYLGGANPFSESPLIVSFLNTAFQLPFYAPGLASAWLVWHGSKDENLTRMRYIEITVMLILIQVILSMIIPCVMADTLCIPTPTTGLVALLFGSKVVKDIEGPWSENDTFVNDHLG